MEAARPWAAGAALGTATPSCGSSRICAGIGSELDMPRLALASPLGCEVSASPLPPATIGGWLDAGIRKVMPSTPSMLPPLLSPDADVDVVPTRWPSLAAPPSTLGADRRPSTFARSRVTSDAGTASDSSVRDVAAGLSPVPVCVTCTDAGAVTALGMPNDRAMSEATSHTSSSGVGGLDGLGGVVGGTGGGRGHM